jgi:acetoin utilization deacetylase AcuC-like enzyme
MARPVYLSHPSSLAHDTGPHPETAARITAIEHALGERDWLGFERVLSAPVEEAKIAAVHDPVLIDELRSASAAGAARIDADTVVSEHSFEAALHAAGGACELVDRLLTGDAPTGFSGHRPPGHHAEQGRSMGFCLFNNVAVASAHALNGHGRERVLVLDWDVHHGNGTNDIFHDTRSVCYVSIHQSPLYPGTGRSGDVGSGAGEGYTVNLPVPPGSGDETFVSLVEHVVVPLARVYAPELVLISAGFDAHADDPLAECRVTEAGYAAMAAAMRRVADECGAPLGVLLEGGYALGALAASTVATLEALVAEGSAPGSSVALALADVPVHPLAVGARERLAEWWDLG